MPHRYRRTDRVDELLKEEIAGILRELKDPRVGFVTVMDVEVSPDLRHARVFVSVLGDEEEKIETIRALDRASGFVRARVGEAITLKYLPNLHFILDRTLEKAARIEKLIDEMRADIEPAGDPGAGEPDEDRPAEADDGSATDGSDGSPGESADGSEGPAGR